jgi:hypothetical protein
MSVELVKQSIDSITLQITIPFNRSMLDSESAIQSALNNTGKIATSELLKTFDTDGSDISMGSVKMTSMGLVSKCYQTPYGEIEIERNVYQTSKGGTTFCPLERDARIILTSTPKFAAQISHKMAEMAGAQVRDDLSANHGRKVSLALIQRLSEAVSSIVQIKEESWSYHVPEIKDTAIKTVGIGLDGTCMLMCEGGYRQAVVGTIALYDKAGERQHTTYIAAAPEYGKEQFKERLAREIERAKQLYPRALYIGIADGAHDNWEFLEKHTTKQTLDFYHATEYLTKVSESIFSTSEEKKNWLDDRCHQLKHTHGAAKNILDEMSHFKNNNLTDKQHDTIDAAVTYFKNNIDKSRMNYAESVENNHVIGSGVTEAACKTIVKQRLCKSGMKWKEKGAAIVLSLRTLVRSTGRWEQFWRKVNQYGFPIAA